MLKFIIAALFLGSTLPCFSQRDLSIFEGTELNDKNSVYLYISLGSERLIAEDYINALDYFTSAAAAIEDSKTPLADASFFIHFGQVIAYDNLGWRDQCRQAIGSTVLTLYAFEEEDAGENPEFVYDEDVINDDTSPWTFMKRIASLAPTPDVRMLLLDLINHPKNGSWAEQKSARF